MNLSIIERVLLLVFEILGLSSTVFAQGIAFLEPVNNLDLTPQQEATLSSIKSQSTTSDVQLVRVNPQAELNNQILMQFKS